MKKRLVQALIPHFGNPRGVLGRIAGWTMARRSSNVARSRWAVDLLELRPTDRVLEVGCGPGVALAAAMTKTSHVVGVDCSPIMVHQARRRSRAEVYVAAVEHLPAFAEPFDKALAVNTVGHWDDPVAGLAFVRAVLRVGGEIAVVSQPRCPGATAAHSKEAADELVRLLGAAGYTDVRIETLDLDPPAVCALALVT